MLFSKQTPAAGGTAFAQFDAAWCYDGNGYIFNDTGTSLDVRIGASGSVQTLAAGGTLPIKLVHSMAELYVRRTDQSTMQVAVEAQVGTGSAGGGGSTADMGVIAAASTAAHDANPAAHAAQIAAAVAGAYGSAPVFTVAQLSALTAGHRPPIAYCTDCLVPEGIGSPVVWTGTAWVCTCPCIPATTDLLVFYRALRRSGVVLAAEKTASVFIRPLRFGAPWATTSGAGSGVGPGGDMSTLTYETGTATTGYATATPYNYAASLLARAPASVKAITTSAYYAADSFLSALSDADNEFAVVQGVMDSDGVNTLGSATLSFVTDRGNVLGIGNTGNSANLFAVCRNSSTNTVVDCGVALTVSQDTATRLEILLTAGSAKFYVSGALAAEITTNIPTLVYSGQARSLIVKSTGATPRLLRVSDEFFGLRYS